MARQERSFRLFLRAVGTVALLAVIVVVMPYSWMNAVHQWLGMGKLPTEPIVGYLARSTSAFYAILGGLLWLVSFDLRRYRPVLQYLGLVLGVVNFAEGMPFWRLAEANRELIARMEKELQTRLAEIWGEEEITA